MSPSGRGALLTLEPLIDAVRAGVEGAGWELSGLQKTTSHQFEGRWQDESTRSAYLFFHSRGVPDFVGIDAYLDETSRGLTGNLALVVDLVPLGTLGDPSEALRRLRRVSSNELSARHRRPVTLRLRLDDAATETSDADVEVRFKVRIPRRTITEGAPAVRALAAEIVSGFVRILASPQLAPLTERA